MPARQRVISTMTLACLCNIISLAEICCIVYMRLISVHSSLLHYTSLYTSFYCICKSCYYSFILSSISLIFFFFFFNDPAPPEISPFPPPAPLPTSGWGARAKPPPARTPGGGRWRRTRQPPRPPSGLRGETSPRRGRAA